MADDLFSPLESGPVPPLVSAAGVRARGDRQRARSRATLAAAAAAVTALAVGGSYVAFGGTGRDALQPAPLAGPSISSLASPSSSPLASSAAAPSPSTAAVSPTPVLASSPVPTATPSRPPSPSPSPQRDVLGPEDRLDLTRLGPVRIGMTREEAERAAGVPITVAQMQPDLSGRCTVVRPESTLPGVTFLLVNGRVAMIQVDAPATNRTRSGVRVGSSEQEVRRTYGDALEEQERYTMGDPAPGEDLGVNLILAPAGERQSLLFEVLDGKVISYRTGSRTQVIASYSEGCTD